MSLQNLKVHYESNKIDYDSLIKSTRIAGEYTDNAVLDIVVPNYHRDSYCATTIKHLISSLEYLDTPLRYNLIIMSFNESKLLESLALENDLVYLCCAEFPTIHDNEFSRAFSFNLPYNYLKLSSKWIMCHDSDLLVDDQFMLNILESMEESKTWVQPYNGKRVSNLNKEDTDKLLSGHNLTLSSLEVSYPQAGAPGGSILVPTDLFKQVGGYDPELFWGYGPEDSMFWVKLEHMFSHFDSIPKCHVGNALYSENTTVYHLSHPPSYTNKDYSKFKVIHDSFFRLTHEDRTELLKFKKNLYDNGYV